jgi:hypothetical protein
MFPGVLLDKRVWSCVFACGLIACQSSDDSGATNPPAPVNRHADFLRVAEPYFASHVVLQDADNSPQSVS